MILLDTNVLSALMRDPPDSVVVGWLDALAPEEVWTTAITVFEIRHGLSRMPEGNRRHAREAAFAALLQEDFAGRIAPLDRAASEAAGRLAARREAAGRMVDVRDTLIGGIALARRATVATRNRRHFEAIDTLDPWAAAAP